VVSQGDRTTFLLTAILTLAFVGAIGAGCGGDDENGGPSPKSLEGFLPPPAQLGQLRLERTLNWDNATDFVVQGTVLPEATAPSSAVAQMDDAGFAAGAGEILRPKGGGSPVNITAAAFDSADGATQAQTYLHEQDLTQPCFQACAVNPKELTIRGIPGATAVHQVPVDRLPPGLRPFEAFAVEFTIGSDLFYAYASGDPGDIPPAVFEKGATSFYRYAKENSE
jgi:hypothetical protein